MVLHSTTDTQDLAAESGWKRSPPANSNAHEHLPSRELHARATQFAGSGSEPLAHGDQVHRSLARAPKVTRAESELFTGRSMTIDWNDLSSAD